MIALLLIMVAEVGLSLLAPWPMKLLIDDVLGTQRVNSWLATTNRETLIWLCAGGTAGIFLVGAILNLVQSWISIDFGQRLVYNLSADLFSHVQRLSLKFHARASVGDLLKRVTADTGCIATIIRDCGLPILASALTLVAMFSILATLDWELALVSLIALPPLIVFVRRSSGPIAQKSYEYAEAEGNAYEHAERSLSALPVMQVMGREKTNVATLRQIYAGALTVALSANTAQLTLKISAGAVTAFATAAMVYLGSAKVVHGALTPGDLWIFLAYLASVFWPLESIVDSTGHIRDAAGSARRVLEVLNREQDVMERPGARSLEVTRAIVQFRDVTFGYDSRRDVLRSISLEANPGEVIGLVGKSGAGKTTLMSLVPRLLDPQRGAVLINDSDIRNLTLPSLRRSISVVLQRPILFPISIAENIAYGRPSATRQQIESAARAAQAHDFIMQLPDGYDTVVGERGGTLSGGQRQRITIARALLHDAPILLLDEPTSALDNESETELVAALNELVRNRTTFVIAHRFSTLKLATRIVVLDNGHIIEQGAHDELIAQNGMYASLYRLQFGADHG
jgi:ATP-binding cassette subfamily B protein/subfamily B ATP-binding cassette protein MsbA